MWGTFGHGFKHSEFGIWSGCKRWRDLSIGQLINRLFLLWDLIVGHLLPLLQLGELLLKLKNSVIFEVWSSYSYVGLLLITLIQYCLCTVLICMYDFMLFKSQCDKVQFRLDQNTIRLTFWLRSPPTFYRNCTDFVGHFGWGWQLQSGRCFLCNCYVIQLKIVFVSAAIFFSGALYQRPDTNQKRSSV